MATPAPSLVHSITLSARGRVQVVRKAPGDQPCSRRAGLSARLTTTGTLLTERMCLERGFLRWPPQSPRYALLQARHEDLFAELFPAFLRVVHRDDGPTTWRGPGGVEDLTRRKSARARMYGGNRLLVLIFRAAGEVMDDRVGH